MCVGDHEWCIGLSLESWNFCQFFFCFSLKKQNEPIDECAVVGCWLLFFFSSMMINDYESFDRLWFFFSSSSFAISFLLMWKNFLFFFRNFRLPKLSTRIFFLFLFFFTQSHQKQNKNRAKISMQFVCGFNFTTQITIQKLFIFFSSNCWFRFFFSLTFDCRRCCCHRRRRRRRCLSCFHLAIFLFLYRFFCSFSLSYLRTRTIIKR